MKRSKGLLQRRASSETRWLWLSRLCAAGLVIVAATAGAASEPIRLKVIGGLAGVTQFRQFEEPFWSKRIGELSGGRIEATVMPFDRSGLRAQDMLQLMSLGVVPFGTALLSAVSGDEPQLNAVDLPTLNPTLDDLRGTVSAHRPHLRQMLRERHGIELLGLYAYPAQVIFCTKPFTGLSDMAGRRVRTSSVSQSELMSALAASPVQVPFADMVGAASKGVVDCAITGTLSGYEIGLSEVTTYVHTMAISWGLSIFGAHQAAWDVLPEDLRTVIRSGVEGLEAEIWEAAGRETARGLACNTGTLSCGPKPGRMKAVPVTPEDETGRRRLLVESVLPQWIERCGSDCARAWNDHIAARVGIRASTE